MPRKKRRRPVHYEVFSLHDGAVTSCFPKRKPSTKKIKQDGIHIDADFVCTEYYYGPTDPRGWDLDQRVRIANLLANRMNMRRTVRDLVLPELAALSQRVESLQQQLTRIENTLSDTVADDQIHG